MLGTGVCGGSGGVAYLIYPGEDINPGSVRDVDNGVMYVQDTVY